jgi:TolB protein
VFSVLLATGAAAQETIDIPPIIGGGEPVKIAIPSGFATEDSMEAAREIVQTLRDDLEFSGYFALVDPRLYSLVPASEPDQVRYEDWQSVGADAVVVVTTEVRGDRIDLEARLYDTPGKQLLFASRYGGSDELRRRVAHRVANDLIQHYTGSPGVAMTRIAFVSKHGDGKEIYLMDYDGYRMRRLTKTQTINLSPVWSPTGQELAYVSWRGKQPAVYAISKDGELRTLNIVGGELSSAPDWSRDGQKLVYSSDAPGNSEIYVLNRSSGRNSRLTRNPAIDTSPAFSPTGREIAFTSDRTGAPQIYIMDAEGLNPRRVSWNGSYNDSAAWSPNGDQMLFVSRNDGRFDVMLLDIPSDRTYRLTHGEGNSENPRFSPDGRHIVFASDRAGTYDIYTMRADGTHVRRLSRNGNCFTPDWSP